jgi:hypothetical protein
MLPQAANAELGNFFEALFRRKIFEIWLRLRRLPAVVRQSSSDARTFEGHAILLRLFDRYRLTLFPQPPDDAVDSTLQFFRGASDG